jgi:hypothetical protein
MSGKARPVDLAMTAERPEKAVVRQLWIEKIAAHYQKKKNENSTERLYLTLCGAEGRDLDMLVDQGIIERTETGSLTRDSAQMVAAIENSALAVSHLLRKFPGLKVHPQSYESLLHGSNPTRFPQGINEELCRSRVINLDLNSPLLAEESNDRIRFPLMDFIHKFSTIHIAGEKWDWSLLLTLHGELPWGEPIWKFVTNYLLQNFKDVPEFMEAASEILGKDVADALKKKNIEVLCAAEDAHQRLLLALVPKLIAEKLREQRWSIDVDWSFSYGGSSSAPMVTWAIDFSRAPQEATPAQIYADNVARILERAGAIDADGNKIEFN